MSMLTRAVLLLLALRVLMPPGICVCEQSAPAGALLAEALGREAPSAPEEDDCHDHMPGCPASHISTGLGLRPHAGPGLVESHTQGWCVPADHRLVGACTPIESHTYHIAHDPPPRHLVFCTLQI